MLHEIYLQNIIYLSVDAIFQSLWILSSSCESYHDFLDRGMLLIEKQLNRGLLVVAIAIKIWLIDTEYLCHKWPWICSVFRSNNPIFLFRTCNRASATSKAVIAYFSEYPSLTPFFNGVRVVILSIYMSPCF